MRNHFPRLIKLTILTGDLFVLVLGYYLAFLFVFKMSMPQSAITSYVRLLPFLIVSTVLLLNVNGLLSLARKSVWDIVTAILVTSAELFLIMAGSSYLFHEFDFPRSVALISIPLHIILLSGWKCFFWKLERSKLRLKNTLVVGSADSAERIAQAVQANLNLGYDVIAYCGNFHDASWEKYAEDSDLIILTPDVIKTEKSNIMNYCHQYGKQVFLIPDFFEILCYNMESTTIDDIPVFRAKYLKPTLEQRILKRTFDLLVSSLGLLIMAPLFGIIAIAIKIDSSGPVFYSQIRTGRNNQQFEVYKFRSMVPEAEQLTGPILAIENDPRITRVGRILRDTRLDELPQLLNVFNGEMSIVGPRPERPSFVADFERHIPAYRYRHNIKPGITGLAQVHGKYSTTVEDKLVYDLMYVQNQSVTTDIALMMKTVMVLMNRVKAKGAPTHLKVWVVECQESGTHSK